MPREPYDCTVDDLQKLMPCISCLSRKELLAVLVFIFAWYDDYEMPEDLNQLLADSACFTCQSDKERLNGTVSAVAHSFFWEWDPDDVRDEIKCLLCANEVQLKSALTYLFCKWFNWDGNGNGNGVL